MDTKLELYTFGPAFGLPDPSTFVIKVMMFLKMHKIDAKYIVGDSRKAPLKKIPFVRHAGNDVPDSELILDYLESAFSLPKDELSSEQHAQGHLLCRALEERTYWCVVHFRWMNPETFHILRDKFLASVPSFLRGYVGNMIQKDIKKTLYRHGLGRHSDQTICEFMRRDFQALSELLGDKPFLFGDTCTRYDCTAAPLASVFSAQGLPWKAPDIYAEYPNIKAYWERVQSAYFS